MMEERGKLKAVITKIDGLHQAAGSKNVLSCTARFGGLLRGVVSFMKRTRAQKELRCPCGGIIKPDVVYEEGLTAARWRRHKVYFKRPCL